MYWYITVDTGFFSGRHIQIEPGWLIVRDDALLSREILLCQIGIHKSKSRRCQSRLLQVADQFTGCLIASTRLPGEHFFQDAVQFRRHRPIELTLPG